MNTREVSVILFDRFEVLDAFGPAEMFASLPADMRVECYSECGGKVRSTQNVTVYTKPFSEIPVGTIVLIPGGIGARSLVPDVTFINRLAAIASSAEYVLTVCTGSLLLAKTGLLENKEATTNKMAFAWVKSQTPEVLWQNSARWVVDGKYYTSSGVSAGMDMAIGFITDVFGKEKADYVLKYTEYVWNSDKDADPFAAEQ